MFEAGPLLDLWAAINDLKRRVGHLAERDVAPDALVLRDGATAPTAAANVAQLYVDSADGDLKVIFADGTIKTIATDT